jgi:hypothetical protein
MQSDLLDLLDRPGRCSGSRPPGFDGEVAGGASSFSRNCCWQIRGDDGARAIGATDDDDDVGFAGSGRRW